MILELYQRVQCKELKELKTSADELSMMRVRST